MLVCHATELTPHGQHLPLMVAAEIIRYLTNVILCVGAFDGFKPGHDHRSALGIKNMIFSKVYILKNL